MMADFWETYRRVQDEMDKNPECDYRPVLWAGDLDLANGDAEIRFNEHTVGHIKLELLFQSIYVYIYDREWNKFVEKHYWEFQDGCDDDDDEELDCDHDCLNCEDLEYHVSANNIVNIRKDIMRFLYNALIKYDVQKTLFGRDYETDEASA
jgi:hypothetical protein